MISQELVLDIFVHDLHYKEEKVEYYKYIN